MSIVDLYVAPCVTRYTDFGDLLDVVHGVVWCSEDGYPIGRPESCTIEDIRSRVQKYVAMGLVRLHVLDAKHRTVDYNPHGLI